MNKTAAFFDVDHTILKRNYGELLVNYFLKEGDIGILLDSLSLDYFFKMFKHYLSFKLTILDYADLMKTALTPFKGLSYDRMQKISEICFEKYARRQIYKGIVEKIKLHKKKKHLIVLLTAGFRPLFDPLAKFLEADGAISSKLIFNEGVFTGEMEKPYCIGEGKTILASEYAKQNDVDLNKSYFYTDSIDDLHFLERVGTPIAVNPDFKLLFIALTKGWKILNLSKTIQ